MISTDNENEEVATDGTDNTDVTERNSILMAARIDLAVVHNGKRPKLTDRLSDERLTTKT